MISVIHNAPEMAESTRAYTNVSIAQPVECCSASLECESSRFQVSLKSTFFLLYIILNTKLLPNAIWLN
jgi:hypothetical protein